MKDTEKSKSGSNPLWNFFASVKLSFFLFLTLAVTSVAGTLLPQREGAADYVRAFGEAGARMIHALGLDDMYHSWWFLLLMATLAVNLVICSLNRLPSALKIIRKDPAKEAQRIRKAKDNFTISGTPQENQAPLSEALSKAMGKVYVAEVLGSAKVKGGTNLFSQRGAITRLGVYLVHLSVLIIFAGAMVGNLWGFEGRMSIGEGQTTGHYDSAGGVHQDLPFKIRLDKFTITYYEGSRMPSEYRSDIVIIDQGKEVKSWALKVNHPVDYQGIDFYQSSYDHKLKDVTVILKRKGKPVQKVALGYQKWTKLPGGGEAGVQKFESKLAMGPSYNGAFARILYREEGKEPVALAAFEPGAKMARKGDIQFELVKWDVVPYTGLQLKYDPGVWFIWVGCMVMVVGFLATFYTSHRKIWLRLIPAGDGRTRVEIASSANKNRVGLQRTVDKLSRAINPSKQKAE